MEKHTVNIRILYYSKWSTFSSIPEIFPEHLLDFRCCDSGSNEGGEE